MIKHLFLLLFSLFLVVDTFALDMLYDVNSTSVVFDRFCTTDCPSYYRSFTDKNMTDGYKAVLLDGQNQIYLANFNGTKLLIPYDSRMTKLIIYKNEKVIDDVDINFCNSDGVCNGYENALVCPSDCISGKRDGFCDGIADNICDPDCCSSICAELDVDCNYIKNEQIIDQNNNEISNQIYHNDNDKSNAKNNSKSNDEGNNSYVDDLKSSGSNDSKLTVSDDKLFMKRIGAMLVILGLIVVAGVILLVHNGFFVSKPSINSKDYIMRCLKAGYSRAQIREKLVEMGYSEELANSMISAANG